MTQYTIHLGNEGKLNGFNLNEEIQDNTTLFHAYKYDNEQVAISGRYPYNYTPSLNENLVINSDIPYSDYTEREKLYIKDEDYLRLTNDFVSYSDIPLYAIRNNQLYQIITNKYHEIGWAGKYFAELTYIDKDSLTIKTNEDDIDIDDGEIW